MVCRAIVLGITAVAVAWAQTPASSTTIADQKDVAVTAYNNGLALVRDTRAVKLPSGESMLQFEDVAQQIRPETVGLKSKSAEGSIAILEQNYEYDLISPNKLMEKYVGKKVKLQNFNSELTSGTVEAELLSMNEGPIYKVNNEIFLGYPGNVVLPEIPENLIAKPSLIWTLNNTAADQTLEVTYLTNGVSWSADYVITLAKAETSLGVAGWVTMNNQSGATFTNAQLKLVAGEVNIAPPSQPQMEMMFAAKAMPAAAPPMPQEEAFAEYHLYTMPRRTTIKQNQSKQLALLNGENVKCGKKYEYRGQEYFYSQQVPPTGEEHVGVYLEFRNEEKNGLGVPLPAGVMRVYQEDSEGMLQFAGEDRIKHTPKDENVRLRLGEAFDVIGERVQKEYQVIGTNVHESAYEITLRNHKETDITVDVVEPMPGDWRILEKSHEFVKEDARTAVFSIPVPKDGEVKLTYRVQVRY
ncbi:MAG: DUF4139 domain-containing protein [Candidatus Hydrogenedentes bacterium]|nr:DUF4139 domain-containing protein [Candidatus Hydrogenedentota bacterium]